MKKVEIDELSAQELKDLVREVVREVLRENNSSNNEEESFVSRQDAANLYGVHTVTIDEWRRKGILKSYRIGSRVLFKHSELHKALKSINK